jgi:hypothetical protein
VLGARWQCLAHTLGQCIVVVATNAEDHDVSPRLTRRKRERQRARQACEA